MFPSSLCLQTLHHSPLLFSVLFLVAPRIPHAHVCHFPSSFLPLSLLFGSAAALQDAWHLSIMCTQEDHTRREWVQRRAERQMSKKRNEQCENMFEFNIFVSAGIFALFYIAWFIQWMSFIMILKIPNINTIIHDM